MSPEQKKEFRAAIYELALMVPYGRVTTYGMLARAAGFRHHSRMVGRIIAESSAHGVEIPAHRIVGAGGVLSGRHAFNKGEMQSRLEDEGVTVANNRIMNWHKAQWDPMEEL